MVLLSSSKNVRKQKHCIGKRNIAFILEGKLEPFFPRKSANFAEKKNLGMDIYLYEIT